MSGFGYIMRCIKSMNFKNLFATVNEIHGITGKNRPFLFCDVVWCGLRYGAGYRDYRLNEWWTLNGKQRKTYVTRGINNSRILSPAEQQNRFQPPVRRISRQKVDIPEGSHGKRL